MTSIPNIRREGKAHNITLKMQGRKVQLKKKGKSGFPTMIRTDSKALAKRAVDALIPNSSRNSPSESSSRGSATPSPRPKGISTPMPSIPQAHEERADDEPHQKMGEDDSEEDSADESSIDDDGSSEDEDEDDGNDVENETSNMMNDEGSKQSREMVEKILNDPSNGNLQSQYNSSFRIPDVYRHKETEIPVPSAPAPARAPVVVPPQTTTSVNASTITKMSKAQEKSIKYVILWKISKVVPIDQRADIEKLATIDTPMEDLQDIYNRLKKFAAQNSSLDFGKTICTLATGALETLMVKQKYVDMSAMKGWSQSMNIVLEDGVLDSMMCEMLSDVTENMSTFSRFMIAWAGNGVGYYISQQQAKKMSPLHNTWGPYLNSAGSSSTSHIPVPTPAPVPVPPTGPQIQATRNANDLNRKVQERDAMRKQQAHENMIRAHQAAAPQQPSIPVNQAHPSIASPTETPAPVSAQGQYSHFIPADQIGDYEDMSQNNSSKRRRSIEPDDDNSSTASDESASTTASKRQRRNKSGQSKTAQFLQNPQMNPQVAKIFRLQRRMNQSRDESQELPQDNGYDDQISMAPVSGGFDPTCYMPMRPQTQPGPSEPLDPREGQNLSMFSDVPVDLQPMY